MSSVAVTVNGKRYQIACENGQEAHLTRLAGYVDKRIKELVAAVGRQVSDELLLVMASLLIADELSDVYTVPQAPEAEADGPAAGELARLGALEVLARRMEAIADRAERS